MFRLSCWFLVALLFSVHCLQRQILYSRLYKQMTNSSLAVPLGKVASRVHCAILCFGDDHCAEFLYSETIRQCVGLHCVKKGSYSYQYIVLETAQMLHYEKEFNWVKHSGHFYFYGEEKLTWDDAKLECQKKCAHLVEIETKEESDWLAATFFLRDHMTCNTDYQCSAWTGLNDIDTEGRYVWDHSNAIALFTNWYPGEPRDIEDLTRDCIDMLRNGQWNDRPCSSLRSFICEKSI